MLRLERLVFGIAMLSAAAPAFAQEPVQKDWWRLYNDPVLDGLVGDALARNTDGT